MSHPLVKSENQVTRRKMFASATTLGALAATASLLPTVPSSLTPAPEAKLAPARGGGYTLSEHVKRYYRSTLV